MPTRSTHLKKSTRGCHPIGPPRAPQGPITVPYENLAPALSKGFNAATRPRGTDVPQVDQGTDQIPCQQDQYNHKREPVGHHPSILPRLPHGSFNVLHKCLEPAVGKGFHADSGPTGTAIPQLALEAEKKPAKRINAFIRVDLADSTLQACQDLLKDSFL